MDSVEDIKSRLDIVDLVSEYLALKPSGQGSFKACCPFHHERTPSFYVSRNRQTWHCFGCNEGGDQFSFVQKIEGMEFREALEFLAQKTGVELPKFDHEKAGARKRLFEVNDLAAKFFQNTLQQSPGAEVARAYLKKRGLDDLTVDLFKLGYAPSGWTTLTDALLKKNVTADELIRAGLSSTREQGGGTYDRFRERVMFPIQDVHGNIVGFTGRILTDDKTQAKYVNTPETAIYHKSSMLYGLDKAKGEIRQKNMAVLVEGNMDVISSHQFGVCNVVAASGTALTQDQLNLIKRFTQTLVIAFDQDAAGRNATMRGLDMARAQQFNMKIIQLPADAGKDPDEAVRKDPEIWKRAIADAMPIMDWVYLSAFRGRHPEQPQDKKLIAHEILSEVRRIADPIERDHWIKRLSRELDVSEQVLQEVLGATRADPVPAIPRASASTASHTPTDPITESEKRLLACALSQRELWDELTAVLHFESKEFRDPELQALYACALEAYALPQNPAVRQGAFPASIPHASSDNAALLQTMSFLAERDFAPLSLQERRHELYRLVASARDRFVTDERQRLAEEMRQAERVHDDARIAELTKAFGDLQIKRDSLRPIVQGSG